MLNRRSYTFADVERITARHRIHISTCPHKRDILAYYCTRRWGSRRRKFIVLNEGLDETTKTFVCLHELAHHFLHAPPTAYDWHYCKRSARFVGERHDCEADAFATIAMIPLSLLYELSGYPPEDLSQELVELCLRRKRIFDLYEI